AALQELLNAFRERYHRYETIVHEAIANSADAVVLWRLGDDLNQYLGLINEATIFPEAELQLILHNVGAMQNDVRLQYNQAVDQSHQGHPVVIETVQTGSRGRPSYEIDPDFLQWAYSLRSTSSIARFLGVSRATVRTALLAHGIAPQESAPVPEIASYTGPLSTISDDELDNVLIRLRRHFLIHGFIDGYSRLITGLLASNNNRGQTVLDLFFAA
ncbi:hypothetical protein DFH06DRAFT_918240, partial [Mycena polygramma]